MVESLAAGGRGVCTGVGAAGAGGDGGGDGRGPGRRQWRWRDRHCRLSRWHTHSAHETFFVSEYIHCSPRMS